MLIQKNLFKDTKILIIRQIFVYCTQLVLYKFHNDLLPDAFSGFFQYNHSIHSHFTRQLQLLHVPIAETVQRSRTLRIVGVKINNHFEKYISHTCALSTYKQHLKSHILRNELPAHILGQA